MCNDDLTLDIAFDAMFKEKEQRDNLKVFLAKIFLFNREIYSQDVEKEESEEVKNILIYLFDRLAQEISISSYEDSEPFESFISYFEQYQNLREDLISQLKSEKCFDSIKMIFESKKLFFLIADDQWKTKLISPSARIKFLLIGKDEKSPTIEINIS